MRIMKKKLTYLFVLISGLLLFSCQSGNKEQEKSQDTVIVVEKTIHIGGMHCDMCEASIEKGLNALEGIESVTASWNDSIAVVKYSESQTNLDEIEKVIQQRGYSVKSVE